ncbi:MAG: nickel-responsive transcriptional regulator NikR [Gemmataceae bacterium]|jgi:CopG family nickel-responsive transcriptional regulator|nr:nickel-responsive transcriptional regulator NikR [Gemmataceae bacterium]
MSELQRFSVSLEEDLLQAFDRYCTSHQIATRSEAFRQLIREKLTAEAWTSNAADVAASLTLVYDHHKSNLTNKMIEIQHKHTNCVVSALHVHLTHELCMELIALRGPAKQLQALAAELSGLKGIHQAQLVVIRAENSAGANSHCDGENHDHEDGHGHRHGHSHSHGHRKR